MGPEGNVGDAADLNVALEHLEDMMGVSKVEGITIFIYFTALHNRLSVPDNV